MAPLVETSPDPEKSAFYAGLVEACVAGITAKAGKNSVRALLMIGAPSRGEATVTATPSGLFSLSDIDLVCVPAPGADVSALREQMREAVLNLNAELNGRCAGVDVSVKTGEQLSSPAPAIATYEMARSPVVVWGDEGAASLLKPIAIADIPATDSLVLLHNRMIEELLRGPDWQGRGREPMAPLFSLYTTAKLVLDAITAYLVLTGDVPVRFGDRVARFMDDRLTREDARALSRALEPYLSEIPDWAAFKASGDASALVSRLGASAGDMSALADECWDGYIDYAGAFLRCILGRVVGRDLARSGVEELAAAYGRVESLPRRLVRARRTLGPGSAGGELYSPARVWAGSRLGSPRLLSYLTGVLVYMSYSEDADWATTDRLLNRYSPFALPSDFGRMTKNEKRAYLIEKIALLHERVLLGRKGRSA
jgi:hypothetical protein